MEETSRPPDKDAWVPPLADGKKWKNAWLAVFQETQAALSLRHPEEADAIRLLTREHLILEFSKGELCNEPVVIRHGLGIPVNNKEQIPLHLSEAESGEILNRIDPALRIELARDMFWTLIDDIVLAAKKADKWDGDLLDQPSSDESKEAKDVSWGVPELEKYIENDTYQEDFSHPEDSTDGIFAASEAYDKKMEDPAQNPMMMEIADMDPSLRTAYFSVVDGNVGR